MNGATTKYNFVNIIVSGEVFKTLKETLERYPTTLLGSDAREKYWEADRHAYVFHSRCRRSFESILYFYQSEGILSQPKNVVTTTFTDEVEFFKIPIESLRLVICGIGTMKKRTMSSNTQWSYKHATITETALAYPPSNVRYAGLCSTRTGQKTTTYKVIMMCDLVATLLLVFCHIVSTIHIEENDTGDQPAISDNAEPVMTKLVPELAIKILEVSCVLWILSYYIAGLVVATERLTYIKSFMSMVDAVIVVAVLLDHILYWLSASIPTSVPIRAIGVLRLFNLARHSNLLYCLGLALKQSFSDLIHVLFVIVFIMFLAAGFVYFAEQPPCGQYDNITKVCSYNISLPCVYHRECADNQTDYISIFASSYWAAVTITTVGYGDMVPKTTFGKIVGSILALIGLPLIAIPMPLIMTKFENLYSTLQEQQKEGKRQKQKQESQSRRSTCHELKNKASRSFVFFGEFRPDDDVTVGGMTHGTISNISVAGASIAEVPGIIGKRTLCFIAIRNCHMRHLNAFSKSIEDHGPENGEPPDQQSWAENWKQVYGRCPDGSCNSPDCRQCNKSNGANGDGEVECKGY